MTLRKSDYKPRIRFRPGEDFQDRHQRRFRMAKKSLSVFRNWCRINRLVLHVHEKCELWCIHKTYNGHEQLLVSWRPRDGEFIVEQGHRDDVHVHDITQLISEIKVAQRNLKRKIAPRAGERGLKR